MSATLEVETWAPPFVAIEPAGPKCPHCGGSVAAREQAHYTDGEEVEAFCSDCHAELTVTAEVEINFTNCEARE